MPAAGANGAPAPLPTPRAGGAQPAARAAAGAAAGTQRACGVRSWAESLAGAERRKGDASQTRGLGTTSYVPGSQVNAPAQASARPAAAWHSAGWVRRSAAAPPGILCLVAARRRAAARPARCAARARPVRRRRRPAIVGRGEQTWRMPRCPGCCSFWKRTALHECVRGAQQDVDCLKSCKEPGFFAPLARPRRRDRRLPSPYVQRA